jgi:hypothetical protein
MCQSFSVPWLIGHRLLVTTLRRRVRSNPRQPQHVALSYAAGESASPPRSLASNHDCTQCPSKASSFSPLFGGWSCWNNGGVIAGFCRVVHVFENPDPGSAPCPALGHRHSIAVRVGATDPRRTLTADQGRFPAPWRAEKMPGDCVARDGSSLPHRRLDRRYS